MLISVIVCTHDARRWDLLLETLGSIGRQTLRPHELIVVVDHNPELYARVDEVVGGITALPVRAVDSAHEPGLSGARNTGVELASGEVLAFIDDDAVANANWLEFLAEGYDDPLVWGVGGRVVPRWLAERPSWLVAEFYWVIGCTYRGMPTETAKVRNIHGCNASFRRELFDEVGYFSPALGRRGTFLAGAEETELCLRASAARPNRYFLFSPRSVVRHAVPPARTRWSYFASRCFSEGRSKAWMVGTTGVASLTAETRYLQRLPLVAAGYSLEVARTREREPLLRAGAVVLGSAATVGGFLYEMARSAAPSADEPDEYVSPPSEDGSEPAVSAIVCTFSAARWDLLVRAIESLEHQTLRPLEIIVAVDYNPELAARVREAFPEIHVVENSGPRGLSGARNTAIATSRGEIVAFLDDDAAADPTWLGLICSAFTDPQVLGVGGHTAPEWSAARPDWWTREFDWIVGASYRGMPEGRRLVRNVHGGNAAFRRALFDRVGGFLPEVGRVLALPYGGEETELCIRSIRLIPGARFVHEPDARIVHHVSQERISLRYYTSRCFREGMSKAQIVRHEGAREGLRTEAMYVRGMFPRAARRAASGLLRGEATGLAQAGANALGVSTAVAGFLLEAVRGLSRRRPSPVPPSI